MYAKAGEAILYRPSTNKIILVAPLTFNNVGGGPATKQYFLRSVAVGGFSYRRL